MRYVGVTHEIDGFDEIKLLDFYCILNIMRIINGQRAVKLRVGGYSISFTVFTVHCVEQQIFYYY